MLAVDLHAIAAIRPPVREDLRGTGAPPRRRRPLIAWAGFGHEPRRRRRWPWVSLYVAGFNLHLLIWIYVFSLGYGWYRP